MTEKTNLYRIYYSDGNNRDELGRVSAQEIDQAVEYAVKQYFNPDLEYEEDAGDNEHLYLRIDSCKYCEYYGLPDKEKVELFNENTGENLDIEDVDLICEYCEVSEYIEITLDNDVEPEYNTIYGVNEYADLEVETRPEPFNPTLVAAWKDSPQKGVAALILNTIEDNPELEEGFSPELIKRSKEVIKQ